MSRPRAARLKFLSIAALLASGSFCAAASNPAGALASTVAKPLATKGSQAGTHATSRALPLVFEENAGQLPSGTAFAGRTSNYTVQVRPSELRFGLRGKRKTRTVTVGFEGSQQAKAVGVSDAGFRTNFYLSQDPRNWYTNVHNFNRVALRELYPGIDAEFYSTGNEIEHDFIVAPGSDAAKLAMHLSGAKSATLSATGDVVLSAEDGALKLRRPNAYQLLADGTRQAVDAEFVLVANGESSDLTFKLGAYDHSRALVIDPVITYATYIAGNNGAVPSALTSDAAGNLYLAGTTTSTSSTFGAVSTTLVPATLTDPPPYKVAFIARVSHATAAGGSVNGSQIAWLTYYGATSPSTAPAGTAGDVTANAIALQPATYTPVGGNATAGTLLYIAGQTTATGLPGAANGGTATLSTGTSTYGFVAEFNESDGTAGNATTYATYVDGGNATTASPTAQANQTTNLQAITVDSTGAVTAVGASTGTQYNTTVLSLNIDPNSPLGLLLSALMITPPTSFCTTQGLGGTTNSKGLLTTLPATLGTPTYSTYVCGKATPSATNFYTLAGVSVAPSATAGTYSTYIVTGSTNLDFPMSGVYDQPSIDSAGTGITTPVFFTPGSATATNAFAASLNPNSIDVNWSYWSDGSGTDQSNGLTIDSSTTPGGVVVFGSTTSPSFTASSETSPASSATIGYMGDNPNSQQTGFAVALNSSTGALGGITLLESYASAPATVTAAAADGSGNILFAGSQASLKQAFPTYTSGGNRVGRPGATPLLPGAQDSSEDPYYSGTNDADGFLVRMPNTLSSVDYVAFFGPSANAGSSQAVGVAVDPVDSSSLPGATTSPVANVLLSEMPAGSKSYTTSSAEQQAPQTGATTAAYLAQIAFVAPGASPSFTYASTDGTYTPNPVGYSTQGESALTLTWPVTVAAAGTSQLVFNLPQSQYLSAYTLAELSVSIGGGANVAATDCTIGTVNASANPAANPSATPPVPGPGITCVVPQVPANAAGTTVTFQLSGVPVAATIPAGSSTFQVAAAAYDATGVGYDLTQTIATAGVPALTIGVTAAPALVNAATSATQTNSAGDPVTVTYTYTINNTSSYDSPNTKLATNLNTTTAGTTLLSNATGSSSTACDPTTAANGCDVPAHGSLTYTVSGVYLDSNFSASGTGPFTVTQGVPYVSFSYPMTNVGNIYPTSTTGPTVMVNGTTTITANAITTNQPTYANHTSFQLGDQDVELTASFTNSGKDQAGSYTATVTLPQGYTATASNCPGAAAPYTSCTFTNIAPGATVSFTITGLFNDTGASTDAVAGPLTTGPSPAAVTGSQTSNSVTAQLSSVTSGTSSGTYIQTSTLPPATSIKVTRVNALTYAISAATPIATNTVNELGPLHATYPAPNDQLSYTATIRNTGTSVARGLYFLIALPNAASGTVPVVTGTTIAYSNGLSAANQLTCSYVAAQSGIVCYENDLTPGAPLPTTTPHPTTTPQTYTINFTTSYDETAVPQNVKTVQVTQGNGTIYAAADTYNPASGLGVNATVTAPGASINSNSITIERLTSIVSNVNVSAVGSASGTNYADKTHVTLDSNPNGSAPGTFDTILFQSSTSNMGPNDAAGLVISIPIPALTRVAVPQYCTLNGITGPSATLLTVTAASTMTCATPAFATVASSTAPNQLRAAAAVCPAVPVPSGGSLSATTFNSATNCFAVAFYLKFSDAPTAAGTVVGANASATVGYSAASIAETDVDTPSTPAATTTAAVTTVQRAAHLRLSAPIAAPTYTTGAALTLDASGVPQIAQAALHMDPLTRQVTTGKVYNCLRYAISVINDGPNYVLNPTLSYTKTPATFVPTRVSTGTAPTDLSSVDCAPQALPASTVLSPLATGTTQSAFIDGYFDLGSLVAVNSGTATFTTGNFGLAGYNDSNTAGTTAMDYSSTRTVTLVNTPYTDANNSKFGITAYGTTPQATLIFTNVTAPGITSAFAAASVNCTAPTYDANHPAPPGNVNICFPYGKSPLPADNGLIRNLYQPGKTPQYYQLPTTAVVPTTSGNTTSVCFTKSGAPFADIFVKPERVLLWLIANPSAGTVYNTFPTNYTGFTSPLASQAGDVTSAVIPYLPNATSPSYVQVPTLTFPQIPQAQPSQICGTVNGFVSTTKADATAVASAETFGVLEPTNFPPVAVAGSIAASSSVSKGSTSALSDVYLRRSVITGGVVTTYYTYDYNDKDPCYIASSAAPRQTCDDNPYLYTVTFTGGNSTTAVTAPALVSTLPAEPVTSAPANSYNVATNINLSTTTNVFVSVADQATGADAYNTDIATAPGYSANPFLHQGNFLIANYSISNHSTQPSLCDPGTSAVGGYNVTGVACPGGVGGLVTGTERYVRGGQKDPAVAVNYNATLDLAGGYYVLGNIGAQSVTASNLAGAGLIPLPYPSPDPTAPAGTAAPITTYPQNPYGSPSTPLGSDPTTKAATAAIASVTAGQTAGFVWPWLSSVTQAQGIANGALPDDQYTLACFLVDNATQQTPEPFPTGVSCNISTTTLATASNPNPSPSVYTFLGPLVPNGSSSPTIYITTAGGTLYGATSEPAWKRAAEGLALAMLFPVLFFRKRLGRGATLAIVMLMLAAAPLLSGCGTGGGSSTPIGPVTPAGNYLFRVTATPMSTAGGEAKITSAVFEVSIH